MKNECREKNGIIDDLLQSKAFGNMEKSQLDIEQSQLKININELRSENSEFQLKIGSLEKDLNRYKINAKDSNKVLFFKK